MSDLNILLEELERQQYEEESDPNLLEDSIIALKKLEAERDALQKAILQFKENPISRNKFKMFDLIEGQG